jgi:hypothetical protein
VTDRTPTTAILRPKDPQLALARSQELLAEAAKGLPPEEQTRRFNENLRAQEHTFVGILGPDNSRILDHDGNVIGETQPGDALVDYDELRQKFGGAHECWDVRDDVCHECGKRFYVAPRGAWSDEEKT